MVIPKADQAPWHMLSAWFRPPLFGCTRGLSRVVFFGYVISFTNCCAHVLIVPKKNVLAGALFSPFLATLLLAVLTTIGSIIATLLSAPLSPFLARFLPRPLALARSIVDADSGPNTKATSPTWVRLTVLRLVGIVPWSGINVACGVLGVSLCDCSLGAFIGAIPWTAVTCQVCTQSPINRLE
jgi:uncharacterized membrane protein YdjX (TVP38/TMEM64 family)